MNINNKKFNICKNNALVLSYHNYKTFRYAGMHAISEALSENDWAVVFWSVSRPYIYFFSSDERLNWKNIKGLTNLKVIKPQRRQIKNIAIPSFELIGERKFYFIKMFNQLARYLVFLKFKTFCERNKYYPELLIFESCEGLYYYHSLKKVFPLSKAIYRASDLIINWHNPRKELVEIEKDIIEDADLVLLVNDEQLEVLKKLSYKTNEKIKVLENGFFYTDYLTTSERPEQFPKNKKIACYVGAMIPNWEAVYRLANECEENLYIVLICPSSKPPNKISKCSNIMFIPGINYYDVAKYIQNCDLFIIPYPDKMKNVPIKMHSKVLSAMACEKPIIALNAGEKLSEYGIYCSRNIETFIKLCKEHIDDKKMKYKLNLYEYDWNNFKIKFMNMLNSIL
jgi:glycosyltransferase involved in cell wall biosynthesis